MIRLDRPILIAHKTYTKKPDLDMFKMHTHDTYEIYCFLSGSAKYYVEGNIYNLKIGDILIIKKAEAHTLLINAEAPYERIVVNFNTNALLCDSKAKLLNFLNNKPLGKNNRYAASKFTNTNWLYYLENICRSDTEYEKRIYLTVLINELARHYNELNTDDTLPDSTSDIIGYINSHLTENISLDSICAHFYLSKSHLNRKFKQMTGSTVWEYIITKRLLIAKELLKNGEHPTTAYIKSGFNDYCTFYRAYKTKFKVSPKTDFISFTKPLN